MLTTTSNLLENEAAAQDIQQHQETEDDDKMNEHQTKVNNEAVITKEKEQKTPKEEEESGVIRDKEKKIPVTDTARITTPSPVLQAANKRKLGARDACNAATENISKEHPKKTKRTRASEMMKTPATKTINGGMAREFSFARPTESSARRTAALTESQTHVKATPPPFHKQLQRNSTPAKAQYTSTTAHRTPAAMTSAADKASRSHCGYTPYTGPLPPLTVESSFAPKSGQALDRRAWSASSATTKGAAIACKPRSVSAKKAQQQNTTREVKDGAKKNANGVTKSIACSSRASAKQGKKGFSVSNETFAASKEMDKAQRLLAQQTRRANPVSASPSTVQPTV